MFIFFPFHALPFPNEPHGFGGIAWGTHITRIPGMELLQKPSMREGVMLYKRKDDALTWGKVRLKQIEYAFKEGLFNRVIITVEDLYNFILLRDMLFEHFGKGKEIIPGTERYVWDGNVVRITLIGAFDIS